jgi:hypothetical protein
VPLQIRPDVGRLLALGPVGQSADLAPASSLSCHVGDSYPVPLLCPNSAPLCPSESLAVHCCPARNRWSEPFYAGLGFAVEGLLTGSNPVSPIKIHAGQRPFWPTAVREKPLPPTGM